MFHEYEDDYGSGRVAFNAVWGWSFLVGLIISILVCFALAVRGDRWESKFYEWVAYNKTQDDKIETMKDMYAKLLIKYQDSMCAHRNLVVTKVENTILCMDPDSKALYKVDKEQ